MKYLCLFLFSALAFGQEIPSILERDPFDPARGVKEEEAPEETPEEEVIPVDKPVLDGTIIMGKTRMAMFTYMNEGKPTSARARVNEKLAQTQYTVTSIEYNKVVLSSSTGAPLNLELYKQENKANRGGTKKVAKPKPKPRKPRNTDKKKPPEKDTKKLPNAKKKNNNAKKNDKGLRRPPRRPVSDGQKTAQRLKTRF